MSKQLSKVLLRIIQEAIPNAATVRLHVSSLIARITSALFVHLWLDFRRHLYVTSAVYLSAPETHPLRRRCRLLVCRVNLFTVIAYNSVCYHLTANNFQHSIPLHRFDPIAHYFYTQRHTHLYDPFLFVIFATFMVCIAGLHWCMDRIPTANSATWRAHYELVVDYQDWFHRCLRRQTTLPTKGHQRSWTVGSEMVRNT